MQQKQTFPVLFLCHQQVQQLIIIISDILFRYFSPQPHILIFFFAPPMILQLKTSLLSQKKHSEHHKTVDSSLKNDHTLSVISVINFWSREFTLTRELQVQKSSPISSLLYNKLAAWVRTHERGSQRQKVFIKKDWHFSPYVRPFTIPVHEKPSWHSYILKNAVHAVRLTLHCCDD